MTSSPRPIHGSRHLMQAIARTARLAHASYCELLRGLHDRLCCCACRLRAQGARRALAIWFSESMLQASCAGGVRFSSALCLSMWRVRIASA